MSDLRTVQAEIAAKEAQIEALQADVDELKELEAELQEADADEDEYTGIDPSTPIGNIFYRRWLRKKGWIHPRLGVGNHPGYNPTEELKKRNARKRKG